MTPPGTDARGVGAQSPQDRGWRIAELVDEARHGDGIQGDDHIFANNSLEDFDLLRRLYPKPTFCSIQLDVQC